MSPTPRSSQKRIPRTLIVTPTYNERTNLPRFVERVRAAAPDADVLIVDDDSPDGTGAVADALAAADERVAVMHRCGKLGLGTAYVEAFRVGLALGYERFFEMDADLSHDPAFLPGFFAALDAGADAVIGSRNVPGGTVIGWGPLRHLISKGGSLYSRVVLGTNVRDLTSGYKAFSRHALESIGLGCVRSGGYSFQIEMTYRAVCQGLNVVEVPIRFVDRTEGSSKMSWKIFAEALAIVWKLRAESLLGRPRALRAPA